MFFVCVFWEEGLREFFFGVEFFLEGSVFLVRRCVMGEARDGSVSLGVCVCDRFFWERCFWEEGKCFIGAGRCVFFEVFFRRGLFWEVFPGSFVFGCVVSFFG